MVGFLYRIKELKDLLTPEPGTERPIVIEPLEQRILLSADSLFAVMSEPEQVLSVSWFPLL